MDYREKRQCRRGVARNTSISLRPLDPQIWFRFWDGTDCSMRDISLVGAGVYSKEKIPVGTRLSIDLRLGKRTSTIRIFGKVAWVKDEGECFRSGVTFSWWQDDQDKKVVNGFVEKLANTN